jgi:DNA-binding transcriptional LysR family regulator
MMGMAMNQMLEPDLLCTFVAIAESGSFTAAAERVHRTQSAVSMQVKRLEELLRRELFVRAGRSVELTRDGELFLNHARRVLRTHREALAAFNNTALSGTITIGAPDSCASTFLPGILGRFAEIHPLVHVNVICGPSQALLKQVADGTIDLAVITQGCGEASGVIAQYSDLMVWVGGPGSDAHRKDPLPIATFHNDCPYRKMTLAALCEQNRPYRIAYTSVSLAGVKAAIAAGLAVGAMARYNVDHGLHILTEADGMPPLPSATILLVRTPVRISPLLDRLTEHIASKFCSGLATATPL